MRTTACAIVRRDNKREKLLQYGQPVWGIDSGSEAQRVDATIAATRAFFESLAASRRILEAAL